MVEVPVNEVQCPRCNENGVIVHFQDPEDEGKLVEVVVPWVLIENMLSNHLEASIENMIDVGSLE